MLFLCFFNEISFYQKSNKGLCGKVQNLQPCNSAATSHGDRKKGQKYVVIIILYFVVASFLLCALIVVFFILHGRRKNVENGVQVVHKEDLFSIWTYDGKIIYEDIIEAIERFDEKFCIGKGRYRRVYKADLPTSQVAAVKKLHPHEDGEQIDQTSFRNAIQALTEIRHRNIVKLFGFCSHPRCSFLV